MPVARQRSRVAMLLMAAALLWVPFALLRLLPLDGWWIFPSAQAFVLYVVPVVALALGGGLLLRRWPVAALATAGLLFLLPPLLDRATPEPQPVANGRTIVVATSNVRFGSGDQQRLMALMQRHRVDVLALQENTFGSDRRLRAAGLLRQFPVARTVPAADGDAAGLALASRWPVRISPPPVGDHRSLGGVIQLPGGQRLALRSVHPPPPMQATSLRCWRGCTPALAAVRSQAPVSILAGDFNATLDHRPLRRLLASGYRDAAAEVGAGLRPTWQRRAARLTIDHVLVSAGIAVREVTVHRLPGSDHHVVIARLTLPRTPAADA